MHTYKHAAYFELGTALEARVCQGWAAELGGLPTAVEAKARVSPSHPGPQSTCIQNRYRARIPTFLARYTYIYIYMYMCMRCVFIYAHKYIYIYTCTNKHKIENVYMHVIYVYICICTYK